MDTKILTRNGKKYIQTNEILKKYNISRNTFTRKIKPHINSKDIIEPDGTAQHGQYYPEATVEFIYQEYVIMADHDRDKAYENENDAKQFLQDKLKLSKSSVDTIPQKAIQFIIKLMDKNQGLEMELNNYEKNTVVQKCQNPFNGEVSYQIKDKNEFKKFMKNMTKKYLE